MKIYALGMELRNHLERRVRPVRTVVWQGSAGNRSPMPIERGLGTSPMAR